MKGNTKKRPLRWFNIKKVTKTVKTIAAKMTRKKCNIDNA